MNNAQNRVAIVAGCRTPFVKAGTYFRDYSMQDLGVHALKSLMERSKLNPKYLDNFVYSTVLLDPRTPNWAREILFSAGLPKSIYAQSVSNNCISGLVAVTDVAERIALGKISCGIAGGTESMSRPALIFKSKATSKFIRLARAKSFGQKLSAMLSLRPSDFWPDPPSPKEPSTGLTMGQHMEITAQEMGIPRDAQDEVAYKSHHNAAKATDAGILSRSISPLNGVDRDTIIRADTSVEKLAKLKPVFDRSGKGTLTAGNSSPLTDGASAVLLMSEARASDLGYQPLAYIKDYEYSAIDPNKGLLMAPTVAVPTLLKRMGLMFQDFDLIEVHEAFAAQVLANIKGWEAHEDLGPFDMAKMNVYGGSIAIGHPFAATGGRILTTLAEELRSNGLKRGLISICAAGAMAAAMVIETA